MTPISAADADIRAKVVAITGECQCSQEFRDGLLIHVAGEGPRYDPRCGYHQHGEHYANLFREIRALKRSLERLHRHLTARKD